jgi:predicted LPLAT superfamily acyltransferase
MSHWAHLEERGSELGMRFLLQAYALGGRWPFRLCLYPVLLWYFVASPHLRRVSAHYRQRLGLETGPLGGLRHIAAFAETLLDKLLAWSGGRPQAKLHGIEHITELRQKGQGGLLVCAHFGNVELARALGALDDGIDLTILVHTAHAQRFSRMLARINPQSQVNLVQVTQLDAATAAHLAQKVAQGGFVVISADRLPVLPSSIVWADFLGHPAPWPAGPWILAQVLACPVLLMWCYRRHDAYQLILEPFSEQVQLPRRGRAAGVRALVQQFSARLEFHCRQAPFQWFNFFDFWVLPKDPPHAELS